MSIKPSELILRSAIPEDVTTLFQLIEALAQYEKLAHEVTGTAAALQTHLFGEQPWAEAVLAELYGQAVGFALFFPSYSTFLTQPGIYLEDLFVLPEYRRLGIGQALLIHVAQVAVSRGCGRLDWSVLNWNKSAIAFYQRQGATLLMDWQMCRVTGDSLSHLACA
ncbi:MAG TPA: GNAT family N-acetyltransferase [Candidatus Caenarcaniphilales bacterium]